MVGAMQGFEQVERAVQRGHTKSSPDKRFNFYKPTEVPIESKAAKVFVKFFDSISFDVDAFVYFVTRQRDEISVRVFKFVIGILGEWSTCYENDGVTKGTEMYRICKWANTVLTIRDVK